MALADFDGDLQLDVVAVNDSANTVSVLIGTGAADFGAPIASPTGAFPVALAVADFDGDGNTDVVTADQAAATASILFGQGDGSFATPVPYATGAGPSAIALSMGFYGVAPGFATANTAAGSISRFEADGTGVMVWRHDWAAGPSPTGIVATDFAPDGLTDIVVTNGDGTLDPGRLTLLTAQYEFYDRYFYFLSDTDPAPAVPGPLIEVDLGAIGWPSLAAGSSANGGTVSTWLGDGQTPYLPRTDIVVGVVPTALVTADFDGDGVYDVALASADGHAMAVLLNDGYGVLGLAQVLPLGEPATGIAAGDLDGDEDVDLVVALHESRRVAVLLNGETGATASDPRGPDSAAADAARVGVTLAASPNPAQGLATLQFSLPSAGRAAVRIVDVRGREVVRVVDADFAAGPHALTWALRDGAGRRVPAGAYFAVIESGGRGGRRELPWPVRGGARPDLGQSGRPAFSWQPRASPPASSERWPAPATRCSSSWRPRPWSRTRPPTGRARRRGSPGRCR